MSLFEKRSKAIENKDAEGLIACLHDDFAFVRHQTGSTMNKEQMSEMLRGMMGSENLKVHSLRCLYENEEVMVEHTVMNFPDGSCEAIVSFHRLQDGLIIQMETGATPVDK
jgi:hypothetical protein